MPQNYLEVSIGKTLKVDPMDPKCYEFLRVDVKLGFSFDDTSLSIKDVHKRIGSELYPILVENTNFYMTNFRPKLPEVLANGTKQPSGPTPLATPIPNKVG